MSIRYRYVKKGKLKKEDLEGLNRLCIEEENLSHAINGTHGFKGYVETERKLAIYGRKNKFKFDNIGNFHPNRYKEYKIKYNFIFAKDKKDNLLGYICFEHMNLHTDEEIKDLIIVKHMYISNSSNHTNIDEVMFWLLENIVEKCVIYSEHLYRPCNEFNGYCKVNEPFRMNQSMAIKFKKDLRYPMFISAELRGVLYRMKSFDNYNNVSYI